MSITDHIGFQVSVANPIGFQTLNASDAPPIFVQRYKNINLGASLYPLHRHTFQELFWIQSGQGHHLIDGQSFTMLPHTLALITQGQVHMFDRAVDMDFYCLRFSDAFLGHTGSDEEVTIAPFNQLLSNGAIQVPVNDIAEIDALFSLLEAAYLREGHGSKYAIMRHLLSVLLLQIDRIDRAHCSTEAETSADYTNYQRFLAELERSFVAHHDVQYYAHALHMSPSQLAGLLQQMIGKPTKRLILDRILLEAKRYLQFTGLSVKEIAACLGYSDPFHFSKIFKQEIGVSPGLFREQRADVRSQVSGVRS